MSAVPTDIITFSTHETVYRQTGDHTFIVGEDSVTSIRQTDLPAPRRDDAMVKNLCGRFTTFFERYENHGPVSSKPATPYFGRHSVMHHLHGSVSVHWGLAMFKGCCGYSSIKALSEDLFFETPQCLVHMGVFKASLGRLVDTTIGGFLESSVRMRFKCVRVFQRMVDTYQSIKLCIDRFDESELPYLRGSLVPSSVDLTITHTGVLLLRFSWPRCSWGEEAEAVVLRFCAWMAGELRRCC